MGPRNRESDRLRSTLGRRAWSRAGYEEAEELAKEAAQHEAFRNRALLLYGDAIGKQGDVRRAKDIFVGLRRQFTGDDLATATRKLAACNKVLGLPDLDGIRD